MALPYDHTEIEARWRRHWADSRQNEVDLDGTDAETALYNLVEFPYPSADGLHIGHALTYSGADVWGRFQRRRGRVVFQPIGFDSFGINAENFARRVDRHPRELIAATMATYRRQLEALGCAWSWDTVVTTSDPAYFRWTQWVFLRLFEAGLAYQAEASVVWCPSCETVLANEQVETSSASADRASASESGGDGVRGRSPREVRVCERCDTAVVDRVMRQWFLRITRYADRLVAGLDDLDWPSKARNKQRAWIGRTVGDDGAVSYRLHDWLISRQRFWGPPIPIVHCPACGPVPVPDDELPVLLPATDDPAAIRPTGTGRSPLANHPEWRHVRCPRCAGPAERDTDVSDTFLDSAWYFLRYTSADVTDRPWDESRTRRWLPVDQYAGGPEHVARHHLYARFVTTALHDLGLVPFAEPFPRIRVHGILTMGGAKMSKSRGNVVNPDDLIAAHGADVTRIALLFTRPWDADGEWDPAVVAGSERFLARLWRVVTGPPGDAGVDHVGEAVRRVTADVDAMRFNTAIAALMTLVGRLRGEPAAPEVARTLVSLVAPFAPHVAEELWPKVGGTGSVHAAPWPAPPGS